MKCVERGQNNKNREQKHKNAKLHYRRLNIGLNQSIVKIDYVVNGETDESRWESRSS